VTLVTTQCPCETGPSCPGGVWVSTNKPNALEVRKPGGKASNFRAKEKADWLCFENRHTRGFVVGKSIAKSGTLEASSWLICNDR